MAKNRMVAMVFTVALLGASSAWSLDLKSCVKGLTYLSRKQMLKKSDNVPAKKTTEISGVDLQKIDVLDETLSQFARLVIEVGDTNPEAAAFSLRNRMLQEKDTQLVNLMNEANLNEEEKARIKNLLLLKIANLRQETDILNQESFQEEQTAREAEDPLLKGPKLEVKEIDHFASSEGSYAFDFGNNSDYVNVLPDGYLLEHGPLLTEKLSNLTNTKTNEFLNEPVFQTRFIKGGKKFVIAKKFSKGVKTYLSFEILDSKSGQLIDHKKMYANNFGNLIITAEGKAIIDLPYGKKIRVYDLNSSLGLRQTLSLSDANSVDNRLSMSSDGKYIGRFFVGKYSGREFRFWDLSGPSILSLLNYHGHDLVIPTQNMEDFAIDSVQKNLIILENGQVRFFSLKTGHEDKSKLSLVNTYFSRLSSTKDGRFLLIGGGRNPGDYKPFPSTALPLVVIGADGKQKVLKSEITDGSYPYIASLSPDGSFAVGLFISANGAGLELRIWHVPTGTLKFKETVTASNPQQISWSLDGKYISLKSRGRVTLWKSEILP